VTANASSPSTSECGNDATGVATAEAAEHAVEYALLERSPLTKRSDTMGKGGDMKKEKKKPKKKKR
jgi:hypothetical protein